MKFVSCESTKDLLSIICIFLMSSLLVSQYSTLQVLEQNSSTLGSDTSKQICTIIILVSKLHLMC